MANHNFYAVEGGALSLDVTTYVERPIDQHLYEVLKSTAHYHRVCAILTPRQMGKSSLIVRTAHRLTSEESAICVTINLQILGQVSSESVLWFNLLRLICQKLNDKHLQQQLDQTWNQNTLTQPSLRFIDFLKNSVLPSLSSKLVVFLDEIQNLIAWNLQEGVMGVLRSLVDTREEGLNQIAFVLVGVAKPSDLLQTSRVTSWNVGTSMELTGLAGSCEPLLNGLRDVVSTPEAVMACILEWTGGQPFLTQQVCQWVRQVKDPKAKTPVDVEPGQLVEQVITQNLTTNWRQQSQQNHLQEIDHWFNRPSGDQLEKLGKIKLAALILYRNLLNQQAIRFEGTEPQWDLLTSGLVVKRNHELSITNPIYQNVFDLRWVDKKEQYLSDEGIEMADLNKVTDRDVYMLIDQSGSMLRTDEGQTTRWVRLQEQLMGDVNNILKYNDNGRKICEQIIMMPYNVNRFRGNQYGISTLAQIVDFFEENAPMGNANVAPTLEHCFKEWFGEREKMTVQDIETESARGAIFVIYIDGQFDDSLAFEQLVKEMCSKVDDQRIFKIIILGFGKDVNARYFDELDINQRKDNPIFRDAHGNPCNVVVFELVEEIEPGEGVVEVMARQLQDNRVRKGYGQYD